MTPIISLEFNHKSANVKKGLHFAIYTKQGFRYVVYYKLLPFPMLRGGGGAEVKRGNMKEL